MKYIVINIAQIIAVLVTCFLLLTASVLAFGIFIKWWMTPLMEWATDGQPFPFF